MVFGTEKLRCGKSTGGEGVMTFTENKSGLDEHIKESLSPIAGASWVYCMFLSKPPLRNKDSRLLTLQTPQTRTQHMLPKAPPSPSHPSNTTTRTPTPSPFHKNNQVYAQRPQPPPIIPLSKFQPNMQQPTTTPFPREQYLCTYLHITFSKL